MSKEEVVGESRRWEEKAGGGRRKEKVVGERRKVVGERCHLLAQLLAQHVLKRDMSTAVAAWWSGVRGGQVRAGVRGVAFLWCDLM